MRRFGGAMKSAAPSAAQGRQAPSLPGFYRCPPEIHLSPLLVGPSFPPPPSLGAPRSPPCQPPVSRLLSFSNRLPFAPFFQDVQLNCLVVVSVFI